MVSGLSRSVLRRFMIVFVLLAVSAAPALATTIERVVSPGGIEAWLVHEPAVPLITVDFAFVGGAAQDPAGKAGTANLIASLLDEGAGDFDSKTFQDRLDRKAIQLSFQADRDHIRGSLRTLSENRDEAFDDLRLALTAPRFDAADVELNPRADHVLAAAADDQPDRYRGRAGGRRRLPIIPMAARWAARWNRCRDHHRRSASLYASGAGARQPEDRRRRRYRRRNGEGHARPRVRRAAGAAGTDAGRGHGAAGARAPHHRQSRRAADGDRFRRRRHRAQRSGFHGRLYRQRHSRRRSFSSRLYREVREKRGLVYSVYDSLFWLDHTALFFGATATRADRSRRDASI